ncbi:MAG: tetratricopeptide repeat protein, partial [Bacteroidota bacterium]|nr:tetratricopeptide repeat protein [Bacteroidota bacterium]
MTSFGQDWKTVNDLGMDHYHAGDYAKAEGYFREAMDISLAATGPTSNEYISSVTNLGYSQLKQSNYAQAQEYFRIALRHVSPSDSSIRIDQIEAIINLANAFLPAAQYDSCEYYLLKAQKLVGDAVNKKANDYIEKIHGYFEASISIQNSLASLYHKKGLLTDAIAIMARQRIDIQQAYPDEYRSLSMYNSTLNNLSNYYMAANEKVMAKNIVKEQISVAGENGEKSIDYLYALNNLASMYRLFEQPDSAEYVWKQSLLMIDSTRYHGSDLHISILNNLGEIYSASEIYGEARRYLTESLSLQEKRPAINPRIYQTTLLNLCETDFWSGELANADGNYRKLTGMLLEEILHNFTYLSDREKISFYRSNLSILESYTFFAFEAAGAFRTRPATDAYLSADAIKDLFNILLTTKGLILHPGYRLKTAILASANPQIKTAYEQWESDKNEYASLAQSEHVDIQRLQFLKQQTESLEKWLRIHSPEFQKGFVIEQKTWKDIQKALSPSEAAVELVRLADGLIYG